MPALRHFFALDRRGTVRLTICIGPWAVKIARTLPAAAAIASRLIYGSGASPGDVRVAISNGIEVENGCIKEKARNCCH
jgi:hypothetical protein